MMTWTQLPLVSGLSYLICVIFKFGCTIVQQTKCANFYLLLLRRDVKKNFFIVRLTVSVNPPPLTVSFL